MVKFQRLIIMVVILLGCNFAKAELVVEPNGRVRVPTGGFNENGVRTWRYLDNGRGGMGGNMFYHETASKSLSVREASTGLRSASTVPVTIEANVSRQRVLSGAFGLVKRGAALGTRLSGWGTAAYFAYEAYQAVKGDLESQGYHYDASKEEFYKDWAARSCIWERDKNNEHRVVYVDCFGVDSSITRHKSTDDPKKQEEIKFLMEAQMERLARPYWKGKQKRLAENDNVLDWNKYIFDKCYFNWNGGSCDVARGDDKRSVIHFSLLMNSREVLTPQKFLEIATPKIDSNPTPFVEGTGRPGYSEGVQVSPTVVTLGPVTGSDGRPIQIQITFGKDSNGKTTATVTTTPRPDLTPGSPAAPKTNPTPTPGENGKPGGQPNSTPDDNPKTNPDDNPKDNHKPDPDDSPSGKDKPKPDDKPDSDGKDDPKKDERPKEDDKPKEDGGLLCKVFPNILACDELPEKEEPNLEIPEEQIDLNFTPDNTFSEYGECPAPVTFQALGAEYKISLEPACNLAAMMRPFIIAMAWLVASFFVARVVRNNA